MFILYPQKLQNNCEKETCALPTAARAMLNVDFQLAFRIHHHYCLSTQYLFLYAGISSQRCPDLWFSDGTIVIRAQERNPDGDKITQIKDFRVYRGILEQYSDGILAKDNIDTLVPEEKEDGCPVLPFYDDPIDDVTRFLKVLYCYE